MTLRFAAVLSVPVVVCAGCATAPTAPPVPASLAVPAGQSVHLEALAAGVQIYACAQTADGGFAWVFKGPEATLRSPAGQVIGKHYAGPTWEANDGSLVVGEVKAKDPGPKATAIPWLLLVAKSHGGTGTFAATQSIQRVATEGGLPPSEPCTAKRLSEMARVPYTASYYFYR